MVSTPACWYVYVRFVSRRVTVRFCVGGLLLSPGPQAAPSTYLRSGWRVSGSLRSLRLRQPGSGLQVVELTPNKSISYSILVRGAFVLAVCLTDTKAAGRALSCCSTFLLLVHGVFTKECVKSTSDSKRSAPQEQHGTKQRKASRAADAACSPAEHGVSAARQSLSNKEGVHQRRAPAWR